MAPDLALVALIAFYITISIFDTVKLWKVERKAIFRSSDKNDM